VSGGLGLDLGGLGGGGGGRSRKKGGEGVRGGLGATDGGGGNVSSAKISDLNCTAGFTDRNSARDNGDVRDKSFLNEKYLGESAILMQSVTNKAARDSTTGLSQDNSSSSNVNVGTGLWKRVVVANHTPANPGGDFEPLPDPRADRQQNLRRHPSNPNQPHTPNPETSPLTNNDDGRFIKTLKNGTFRVPKNSVTRETFGERSYSHSCLLPYDLSQSLHPTNTPKYFPSPEKSHPPQHQPQPPTHLDQRHSSRPHHPFKDSSILDPPPKSWTHQTLDLYNPSKSQQNETLSFLDRTQGSSNRIKIPENVKKTNSAVSLHAIFVKGSRGRLDTSPRGWGVRSELVPEMQSDDLMGGGGGSSEDGGGRGVDVGGRFEYPGSITNLTPGNLGESDPAPENEARTKFTPTKANHLTYHNMPSSQLHYSSKMPDPVTERESEQFQPTTLRDRSPLTPSPQTPNKTDISDLKQQIRILKSENDEIGKMFT
jgi:hypothetical protein